MILGYHVSTGGGLPKAFKNAEDLESTSMQIFVGSPQSWATPDLSDKIITAFKEARAASPVEKVLVHAAYLPNPSSHKPTLRNLSLKKMKDEAKASYLIGADGYNFHCGSNQNGNEEGVANIISTLNRLAELTVKCPVKLIIENDAGAGNRIGDTIEELALIWKGLEQKDRFGFCLDTCHLFVSGIDIRTKKQVDDLVKKFDKLIGIKHLEFMHLNDTKFGLDSRKDRHENIGKGLLTLDTFKAILTHPKLTHVAFVLETPRTGDLKEDIQDIKTLRKLVAKK